MPDSALPRQASTAAAGATTARRQALIASLRQRFAAAEARADARAKQALFQEAVALNLPPALWQEPPPPSRSAGRREPGQPPP
jgi:hypothetical protein